MPSRREESRQTELTISLDRLDGARVRAEYFHDGHSLGEVAYGGVPEQIELLGAALREGHGGSLEPWITGPGQLQSGAALYALLFPERARTRALPTALELAPPGGGLNGYPMRIRVVTDDPLWAALPWPLTTWRRQRLWSSDSNWTFETAKAVEPSGDAGYGERAPRILVYAPTSRDIDPTGYIDALHGLLERYDPIYEDEHYFRHVESLRDLRIVCRGRGADLVYIFAHVSLAATPQLTCSTGATAAFIDLRADLVRSGAAVLFINGCRAGSSFAHSAAEQFAGYFDAVIAPCSTVHAQGAADMAKRWFENHVVAGRSPVEALLHAQPANTVVSGDWALPVAFTRYGDWYGRRLATIRPEIAVRLDRLQQRALAVENLRGLLNDEDGRVQVFVGIGERSNLVEKLGGHLRQHIGDTEPDVNIVVRTIRLPDDRTALVPQNGTAWAKEAGEARTGAARLEALLADALECPAELLVDRISDLCTCLYPGQQTVLWLDWGAYGDRTGLPEGSRPALGLPCATKTLGLWLQYQQRLAKALEGQLHVRIVASLGLEEPGTRAGVPTPASKLLARVATRVKPGFVATRLPYLSAVDLADLRLSLHRDKRLDKLPRQTPLFEHITQTLIDELGPEGAAPYDELVEAIAEGERTNWGRFSRYDGEADDDDLPDLD